MSESYSKRRRLTMHFTARHDPNMIQCCLHSLVLTGNVMREDLSQSRVEKTPKWGCSLLCMCHTWPRRIFPRTIQLSFLDWNTWKHETTLRLVMLYSCSYTVSPTWRIRKLSSIRELRCNTGLSARLAFLYIHVPAITYISAFLEVNDFTVRLSAWLAGGPTSN